MFANFKNFPLFDLCTVVVDGRIELVMVIQILYLVTQSEKIEGWSLAYKLFRILIKFLHKNIICKSHTLYPLLLLISVAPGNYFLTFKF